ncbi:(Fe-S)-binding protein [Vulcanisaeta moutnovskia]|mgnify:FL=1|nr:(Fe-S)-binding protein [Vulcanisaeta moutnovskia]
MDYTQLCYAEYFGLPKELSMIIVYSLASLTVILFFYFLKLRLNRYGIGLWEFILILLKGYRAWLPFLWDIATHRRFTKYESIGAVAHLMILYALLLSLIGTLIVAANQYIGIVTGKEVFCGYFFLGYSLVMDITAWVLFIGSALGIYRVLGRKELYTRNEYYTNLLFLVGFMYLAVSGAIIESYRFMHMDLWRYWMFMPNALLLSSISSSSVLYMVIYYTHFPLAFILIAILPLTAIFHSLLGLYNYIINYKRPLGELSKPFDLKELTAESATELKVGFSNVTEIPKLNKAEAIACTDCFRCQDACPAYAAGRPLSPMMIITKIKHGLYNNDDKLIDGSIADDELWACTTCGACMNTCPVYIRHVDYIIDMRRYLVMINMRIDQKKSSLLLNLSQYNNSMGMSNYGRHDWLKELGVKTIQENPGFEYLLWVGCMGSFDNRTRDIIKSLIEILREANLLDKIAILGDEETCCGDPARRLGEESRFQELALNNIELFRKYNVRNIITICPHGYNTFKNEYPKIDSWMRNIKVMHHSEFLEQLINEGKIRMNKNNIVFTIHDPCYLARHNGVVNPQRNIVKKLGELRETKYHGTQTFCCGAGGANYWYDVPEKKRISHIRLEQLMETNAQTIVTLCPFCNAMLTDAARIKGVEDKVKILDIAEIVKSSIIKPQEVKVSD